MELGAIQESFERVAKKQKLSSSKSLELIDQVGHELQQSLTAIQSDNNSSDISIDHKSVLTELRANLLLVGAQKDHLEASQRELNISLSKHQKLLEKILNADISKVCRNVDFDPHIVNQIIINHFYRENLFDLADCLIKESGEPEPISVWLQFQEIHQILNAAESRDLEPALSWVSANRDRLKEIGSNLELKLHKLNFVEILQNRSRGEALEYARTYLSPLASSYLTEIQKLMGSLLWAGKLDMSPYADLVSPIHREKLADEIMQTFCKFSGQSFRDPLKVAMAAGMEGLPTLLKLANVMAVKKQEWQAMKQLPVPLELGEEFQFHSIFVCPVSRDQGGETNPPMLLPCGHVLCKQSVHKISKSSTRNFKCPYCPLNASVAKCKQLYF